MGIWLQLLYFDVSQFIKEGENNISKAIIKEFAFVGILVLVYIEKQV
jgi:hypothetical protein